MRAASIPARLPLGPIRSKRLLALAGDDTLVEQVRRGNEAAFEIVFERHGPGVLGFCRHMLGSPEEAEDAVQHTFAAAFRDLQRSGERELALKAWLYAIARNRCASVLRARRQHDAMDFEVATVGLDEQVERRAELRLLLRDLRELPESQRAALLLSEAGDLSHAEVAGVLGCEVAKVKALVFRARSGLIQRREARETPCEDIRTQLANLRGGALRRSGLRHHLRHCPGCRSYRDQVQRQHRMLAAALPVAPSLGLKSSVLGAIGIGGGSAGGGLAAGLGAAGSGSWGAATLTKVAVVGVVAGGGAVAGQAVLDEARTGRAPTPPRATETRPPPEPPPVAESRARAAARSRAGVGLDRGEARRAAAGSQPDARSSHHRRSGHELVSSLRGRTDEAARQGGQRRDRSSQPTLSAEPLVRSRGRGRGPIEAPPAAAPVRRGPPEPKEKAAPPARSAPLAKSASPVRSAAPPTKHVKPVPTPVPPAAAAPTPEPAPTPPPKRRRTRTGDVILVATSAVERPVGRRSAWPRRAAPGPRAAPCCRPASAAGAGGAECGCSNAP